MAPLVSIGLPVFNGENYVAEALESLRSQTFEDFEVIVSDNASTDRTESILEKYADVDPRIRVERSRHNRGAGWNFNHVAHQATGKYFKWHAHDDIITPGYLERCVDAHVERPDAVLVHTGVELIDATGQLIEPYGIRLDTDADDPIRRFAQICLEWHLCYQVFGLIRLDHLRAVGDMLSSSHGDGILLGRLALRGPFVEIPDALLHARVHAEQSMHLYGHANGVNDYHAYAEWFDPTHRDRLKFPHWAIFREYRAALSAADISRADRLRGETVIARRVRRDGRNLVRDLVRGGQTLRRRLMPSPT